MVIAHIRSGRGSCNSVSESYGVFCFASACITAAITQGTRVRFRWTAAIADANAVRSSGLVKALCLGGYSGLLRHGPRFLLMQLAEQVQMRRCFRAMLRPRQRAGEVFKTARRLTTLTTSWTFKSREVPYHKLPPSKSTGLAGVVFLRGAALHLGRV